VNEIQRITQIAVTGMEAAGNHVASTDAAMIQAHAGLDTVSEHGNEVVSISRHIADATRQQSAVGNENRGSTGWHHGRNQKNVDFDQWRQPEGGADEGFIGPIAAADQLFPVQALARRPAIALPAILRYSIRPI